MKELVFPIGLTGYRLSKRSTGAEPILNKKYLLHVLEESVGIWGQSFKLL